MAQNLQNIFDSITPDNIKSIPAIKDAMAIFIETLEELSKESIDIRKMFLNPVIKEELVKIYLDDLYKVFKTLQFNQKVVNKIERLNSVYGVEYYKIDVIRNIANYINEEHFLTFKSYKEKKGTPDAIKYIYELVGRKLLSEDTFVPFTLTEVQPFTFNVSGNLPSELYEALVRPLAHPLGFIFQYDQLVSLLLEDVFLSTITYKTNALEVRSLLSDGTTNITNYKYEIDGITPRVVVDLITTQTNTLTTKKIVFADGKYLEQVTTSLGQTYVYYKALNGDTLIAYNVYQSSIYFDYEVILTTTVQEDFNNLHSEIKNDNYARLNPDNNTLSHIETGFNGTRNVDGDYLFPGGTAQAGTATTLTLANSAAGQAVGASNGERITIVYGTGAGQGFRTVVQSDFNVNLNITSPLQLLSSPQDFTNDAIWGYLPGVNWSVTPNDIASPTGLADRVTSVNAAAALARSFTATSTSASFACVIKAGTYVTPNILLRNNTTATPLVVMFIASGIPLGDGWYLLVVSSTTGITVGDTLGLYWGATSGVTIGEYFWIDSAQLTINPIVLPTAMGVAVDTPWTIIPDATSVYALSTGLELTGTGRQENYFEPSSSADLKMLEGKFEKNVVINHPYDGFETQPIKYTDVVNSAYTVAAFVQPVTVYDTQNIENAQKIGKEHLIIQENAIFANQNKATISSYVNVVDVVIGTNGINIGGADDLGTTYKVFDPIIITNNITIDFNDNILYRYFYGSITNNEPVNMTATVDDIFTGVVTRDGVVLTDHNYAEWLARNP